MPTIIPRARSIRSIPVHVAVLERRVEAQAKELHAGVDGLRSGVEAVGRTQAEALAQWERRLERVEAGRAAGDGTPASSPPPVTGAAPQVIGQRPATERPWRYHPELVTRAPEPDEELVYGEATPVIVRWRAAVAALRDSTRQFDRSPPSSACSSWRSSSSASTG